MGFLRRIGNALVRFMYGRNGADQLCMAMILTALALNTVEIFVKHDLVYVILHTLSTVLTVWMIFRMFSKNLAKRRAENAKFLQLVWWPLKRKFTAAKDREHKYFTCPNCRSVCRVPRGKGKIVITCPKCRGEIHGKS